MNLPKELDFEIFRYNPYGIWIEILQKYGIKTLIKLASGDLKKLGYSIDDLKEAFQDGYLGKLLVYNDRELIFSYFS